MSSLHNAQRPSACSDPAFADVCSDRSRAVRALRERLPRPLVFTHGMFDLLHAGHVHLLEQARSWGASLVVGVRGDVSSRHLRKGPGRPFNSASDRARIVAALAGVSAAVLFDEDKPLALICGLRPDIVVKCSDPAAVDGADCALLAEWGGRTVVVPRLRGATTRALLDRLRPVMPRRALASVSPIVVQEARA
jgi:D-glycero-beta-D-manno-heptose 1-phosphate adenylyltransferase